MNDYQKYIRNFSIIAHIDHGKSTLADRIIENTGLVAERDIKRQFLDNMELERERGITIKLQTTRLVFKSKDGNEYILNLIDTPGHVDFNYEVSRSLAACEGAVLVVDSTQGVEAQTMANVYLALDEDLEILPVLNKIDLASSRPDETREEIEEMIGIDASEAPLVSAKEGIGITEHTAQDKSQCRNHHFFLSGVHAYKIYYRKHQQYARKNQERDGGSHCRNGNKGRHKSTDNASDRVGCPKGSHGFSVVIQTVYGIFDKGRCHRTE